MDEIYKLLTRSNNSFFLFMQNSLKLNDISLLQTSTSISFSDRIKAVPMSNIFVNGGEEVQVSGNFILI